MERKLTAILSADVQGYSRLMGEDEEATLRTLAACQEVMAALIQQHRGRVVDSPGDNLLAEFASVVDAVRCAVEIQRALKAQNADLPDSRKMEFRIGVNLGDVVVEGKKLYGEGVNLAARLEGLAEPGGICISGGVHDQVENKLSLEYDDLGEQQVKNIARPVRVYRVRGEVGAAAAPLGRQGQARKASSRSRQRVALAVALVLLLGAGTLVIRGLYGRPFPAVAPSRQAPAHALPHKPSIAVLPFTNLSGDREQEYFSDGITDDLITDLSKISGLLVIARNSTFTYKGQAVDVREVSRKLGVRYVLEGSIRRAGDRLRINAQLVDGAAGRHLWAERYDRGWKDIFALQDEITQKIVFALKVTLTPEEQERFRRFPTDNLEAYDYVLRGWDSLRRFTKEANAQARQMFERAIELDPKYAGAYASLGAVHLLEWTFLWNQDPQTLERAFESAQRAVALDDSLPLAHVILGYVYWWKEQWKEDQWKEKQNKQQAVGEMERAVALNDSNFWAHKALSNVYLWKKQHEQAIAEAERAIALNPHEDQGYVALAGILNFAGRPGEAMGWVEKALRLNPRFPVDCFWVSGHAYFLTGQYEEAIATLKKVLTDAPTHLGAHLCLAASYGASGREEEAWAEAAEVLRLFPDLSLEGLRQKVPYKDPAQFERFINLLRKAGMK